MTLFEALRCIVVREIEARRHPEPNLGFGRDAFTFADRVTAVIQVEIAGPEPHAVVHAIGEAFRGPGRAYVNPAEALDFWLSGLRRDTALEQVAVVLANLQPECLTLLAVALDSAQTKRPLAEYRSPADVARIAELERDLAEYQNAVQARSASGGDSI